MTTMSKAASNVLWAAVAGALVATLLGARPAAAADIPVVTVSRAGPDKAPPLSKPFYVELDKALFKDATRVDVLLVRYWSRPFGAQPTRPGKTDKLRSCSAVEQRMRKWKPRSPLKPGVFSAGELFRNAAGAGRLGTGKRFLVAKAWTKPPKENKAEKRRVLVEGERFVTSGARYCLLLYETAPAGKDDSLKKTAAAMGPDLAAATRLDEDNGERYDAIATNTLKALKEDFCFEPASADADRSDNCAEGDDRHAVSDNAWEDFDAAFRDEAFTAARQLVVRRRELLRLTRCLDKLRLTVPSMPANALPGLPADSGVGHLIAELATRAGALTREGPGYRTNDAKLIVGRVEPLGAPAGGRIVGIRVYDAAGRASARLAVKPAALALGETPVTVEDLVLFGQGRVFDGEEVRGTKAVVAAVASAEWDDAPPALSLGITKLVALLKALSVRAPADVGANDPAKMLAALGNEIAALRVIYAPNWVSDPCGQGTIHSDLADAQPWAPWLDTLAAQYDGARGEWAGALAKGVVVEYGETLLATSLVDGEGYSQERYIEDYVTPIQGFAGVFPVDGDAFFVPYAGVQIYAAANPVDRPMWSRGWRDLGRMLSLELALAEASRNMGPAGRFRGYGQGRFPPLLVGGGLQLLPWVTFSAGAAILERRRSPFSGEAYALVGRWYVAATVQANIPGIIRKLSGRERETNATE